MSAGRDVLEAARTLRGRVGGMVSLTAEEAAALADDLDRVEAERDALRRRIARCAEFANEAAGLADRAGKLAGDAHEEAAGYA